MMVLGIMGEEAVLKTVPMEKEEVDLQELYQVLEVEAQVKAIQELLPKLDQLVGNSLEGEIPWVQTVMITSLEVVADPV